MEKRSFEEYMAYIWDKVNKRYIRLGTSRFRTLEDCKANIELRRKEDSKLMYKTCDWQNIKIKKLSWSCTDWGFIDG